MMDGHCYKMLRGVETGWQMASIKRSREVHRVVKNVCFCTLVIAVEEVRPDSSQNEYLEGRVDEFQLKKYQLNLKNGF